MDEIIFIVQDDIDGGYTAKALNYPIFTESDTMDDLKNNIIEAIQCHFDDSKKRIVRMHYVRDEVFAA